MTEWTLTAPGPPGVTASGADTKENTRRSDDARLSALDSRPSGPGLGSQRT